MGFSLCKHCVIYTPNTQQTSLLHGLHIKFRVKFTRGFLRQHCRIALGERNDTFDRSLCGCQKYLCVTSGRSNKTKASLFRKENCLSKKEVSAALLVRATFIITTADLLQKMLIGAELRTTLQLSARMWNQYITSCLINHSQNTTPSRNARTG